jgi:hypothetical protein
VAEHLHSKCKALSIAALVRQEDCEFEDNLDYIVISISKSKNKNKQTNKKPF